MSLDTLTSTQLVALVIALAVLMAVIGLTLIVYGLKGFTGKHRRRDHERIDRARE